jgi:hypothetical protein
MSQDFDGGIMTELIGRQRLPRGHAADSARDATHGASWTRLAAALVVVAVGAFALAGTWQAIVTLASPSTHGDHSGHLAVGDQATTAFGSMTVENIHILDGLTAEDLGGMTHGIQGLVPADLAQVEIAVRLQNTGADTVKVDPAQFELAVVGSPAAVTTTSVAVRPVSLPAGAGMDMSLTFVVPRAGGEMNLHYTDPVTSNQIDIPVGRVDQAPAGEGGSHVH